LTIAGFVLLAVAALWFASRIPRTLTVFVIAAFVAFGVNPLVARLERMMPRSVAIGLVYSGLISAAVVLALLVVPATYAQVQAIAANAPDYLARIQNALDGTESFMREHFGRSYLPPGYGDLRALVASKISATFSNSLASLTEILVNTFTAAFIGISAVVLSGFFVFRGAHMADSLVELLPATRRDTARALFVELAHVFGSYVSGQLALCTITGALILALTGVLGFKFALLLGIISGIAYAVPFVGMIVAHGVAIVLSAPQGTSMVIWVNVIVFVVARVSDNLLVPKVMSDSVGVSPIVVMFAVFAGGELFGLPGLLLGIPAAALAKVAWRFFRTSTAVSFVAPSPLASVAANASSAPAAPSSSIVG
jgi:predicted PurR-regulated permease PerM